MLFRSYVFICFLLLVSTVKAQLPQAEVRAAVDTAAAQIRRYYVFADKGENIARHLESRYRQGAFRQVASWPAFATLCSGILRRYSGDGHLYVRYSPEKVKNLRDTAATRQDDFFYGADAALRNYGIREVAVTGDNTGYLRLSEINISRLSMPVLQAAMSVVARTRALIIDLRHNGGGGSDTGAVIESYFLPDRLPLLTFHARSGRVETDSTQVSLAGHVYRQPVFILVDRKTASAAEAFAFVMQAHHRAVIVGEVSAGAANMNEFYPVNTGVFISVSVGAPVLPGTTRSWESVGVKPDIVTAPDKARQIAEQLAIKQVSGIKKKTGPQ
ncbi:S41 family peptidase [Chitinophaga nivalis]|uniref:S41 family peptidase n=1 Tax=Chitinophaga nivalis TaxID=2991709 RepID=A0ABT3IHW6_9BACT|nr:S41 family peptidase [Chitinophaga nivalis]MCW3466766.1 S41 family peptidase [Chitinophaga nivalis]MCW3483543.1 S41 family peptidase [Chitinophaga nivalis]